MPQKKQNTSVIAICIQEPFEDGSCMDLGAIQDDDLRFLHQAFISDTITHSLDISRTDVRLYYIDDPARTRFVNIILEYLRNKLTGKRAVAYNTKLEHSELPRDRWGIRIERVFADCFNAGFENVLVIGSRTPTITTDMLKTALEVLRRCDAVFGPTPDGRYYMIGMSGSPQIDLSKFDWKSPSIYSEVADAFTKKGLAWSELDIWYAVETTDDLEMMVRDLNQYRYEGDETTARETEIIMGRLLAKLGP